MSNICGTHGCKLVPITDDVGAVILAEDCPKCLTEMSRAAYGRALGQLARPGSCARCGDFHSSAVCPRPTTH